MSHNQLNVNWTLAVQCTCNTLSYQDFVKFCRDGSVLKDSNVKLKLYDGTVLMLRGS